MPSETPADATRRLHPASLLFSIGAAARRLLFPAIALLFFSAGSNYELWLGVLFVPATVVALVKYATYRYRLGVEEMVVREGVVTRNERHIPYARIQNINLVQNPLHRMLGVAEVHLETAGGSEPEAVIRVLSLASIETLRGQVFRNRDRAHAEDPLQAASSDDQGPAPRRLLELNLRELVLLGLFSNRGMAVVAAAMGAAWQFDVFRFDEETVEGLSGYRSELPGWLADPGLGTAVVLGIGALVALILLMRLLSVAWAVMRFYGFKLDQRGDDLRAQYGLFTRISATIPRQRIQLISLRRTWLQRLGRRSAIQAETAGGGGQSEDSVSHRLWLAPLIPDGREHDFLECVLPEVEWAAAEWRPLAPRASRRLLRRGVGLVILLTIPAVVALGLWGLLVLLPGLALAAAHARLFPRHTAWALTSNAVIYRSGWWVRRLSAVRFSKIQTVALGQSPFDRRNDMATVRVDTAGAGRAGHRIAIELLETAAARQLANTLATAAGRTRFHW